jgi:hypothetical protein
MPCRLERSEDPLPERESDPVPPDALLLVLATLLLIALALGVAVVLWIRATAVSGPVEVPWQTGRRGLGAGLARLFLLPCTIGVCERTHKVSSVTR